MADLRSRHSAHTETSSHVYLHSVNCSKVNVFIQILLRGVEPIPETTVSACDWIVGSLISICDLADDMHTNSF